MKTHNKALLLSGILGLVGVGILYGQQAGSPEDLAAHGLSPAYADINFTKEQRENAVNSIKLELQRKQGQGNWVQSIETKDGKVFVIQLDENIYVIVPRIGGNVEIVSRETNRERIDELNDLFERRTR
jgi:hypothetical protein